MNFTQTWSIEYVWSLPQIQKKTMAPVENESLLPFASLRYKRWIISHWWPGQSSSRMHLQYHSIHTLFSYNTRATASIHQRWINAFISNLYHQIRRKTVFFKGVPDPLMARFQTIKGGCKHQKQTLGEFHVLKFYIYGDFLSRKCLFKQLSQKRGNIKVLKKVPCKTSPAHDSQSFFIPDYILYQT